MNVNSISNKEILEAPELKCITCLNCGYIDTAENWQDRVRSHRNTCERCKSCAKEFSKERVE